MVNSSTFSLQVIFGIFFMALSLLLAVSLTITSVDKLQHSPGAKYGYSLPHPTYPNPANIVMVFTQKIFPLDYVLFSLVSLYFVFAAMCGIKRMGIWCCCIKMFKVLYYNRRGPSWRRHYLLRRDIDNLQRYTDNLQCDTEILQARVWLRHFATF